MSKIAFIFPGQGSQTIGMGKSFVESSELAKEMMIKASERTGIDFEKLLFEENEEINQTENTQPAILLVSMMAHALFSERSAIKPALLLGHSLGEFSAVCAAGALDYLDAVELVNARGKLMQGACDEIEASMMVVLGLKDEQVEEICAQAQAEGKKVWPANYNQDGQLVVAGMKSDLAAMESVLKEAKAKRAMLLNMSVASHCPLLESATAPLAEKLTEMLKDEFIAPVVSNVTAKTYNTKEEALDLLPKQLVSPVLYKQSIADFDDSVDCYVEFGHGGVLKGLNRKATTKPHFVVSDMESLQTALTEIAKLQ